MPVDIRADIHEIADTSAGQWQIVGLTWEDREERLDVAIDALLGFDEAAYVPVREFLAAAARSYVPVRGHASPSDRQLTLRTRERIYARDGRVCAHCQATENLSIDHVIARANGGSDADENLQVLCRSCNSRKGTR